MDVARRLAALAPNSPEFPPSIVRARVGWFGVELETRAQVSDEQIADWLEQLFPTRVRHQPLRLELDGPQHAAELPIETVVVDSESVFRQSFGIVDGVIEFSQPPRSDATIRPVPVVAALSVKGGTGRTTTATAFALRWAATINRPILLVDADLEAPGISYLFQGYAGTPKISLEDVITLAHSEEAVGAPETIAFAAERLRDHAIPGNLFVLPLRRDIDELASSSIRPEHLSTPDHPFALADVLSQIAEKLGCGGVVVDVRAGLVPLGVNLAMDPNVAPILVTTLADQSIRATAALVRFLAREMRRSGGFPRRPLLVINRVPAVFKQTGMDKKLIEPLVSDLLSSLVSDQPEEKAASQGIYDDLPELDPFLQVEIPELPDIQVLSGEWSSYVEQITGSGFSKIIGPGIDQWIAAELDSVSAHAPEAVQEIAPPIHDTSRQELAVYSEQLIAAENAEGQVPKPLVTQSLAALAQRFQSEVPIAVSEGAKGTGKTLAARFFIAQGQWDKAVAELLGRTGAIGATLVPVCASIQSSAKFQSEVDAARGAAAKLLGLEKPMNIYETTSWLKEQFGADHTEQVWVGIWLDVVAWSAGFKPATVGAGNDFIEWLRTKGHTIVAIIEGLEELYTTSSEPGVDTAMRAVLVSLPQKLRSEARRPVGVVVFARRDTVEAAVKQNLDQYRREYSAFALSWTEGDVLELAAWLATQSQALPDLWSPEFSALSLSDKTSRLERLWGKKLGPDDIPGKRTREAYTATWTIAVLSDLRGRLVPRDLVRLLSNAATNTPEEDEVSMYPGRLLVPRALRNAIEPTSNAKVHETEEEISELAPIFAKFRLQAEKVAAPLGTEALAEIGLDNSEVQTLIRHGIVFGQSPPYEVPELFRRGLGLRHTGARRSVVNLYRRARQR
ncbi:cellulose biosynthesis protein BcsQ [Paraburkholderia sp. BL21I4N1]|nr:cellulose biosynthesis protein BcsQ [Paraburkholderia sp. BL21I4N1]